MDYFFPYALPKKFNTFTCDWLLFYILVYGLNHAPSCNKCQETYGKELQSGKNKMSITNRKRESTIPIAMRSTYGGCGSRRLPCLDPYFW